MGMVRRLLLVLVQQFWMGGYSLRAWPQDGKVETLMGYMFHLLLWLANWASGVPFS